MDHQGTTATRAIRNIHAILIKVTTAEDQSSYHGISIMDPPGKASVLMD